jgi:DNA repair exonuclease SbcCD nuclease subunit
MTTSYKRTHRIALTSDLQFDEYARWSQQTEGGTTTRLDDFLKCFEWVVSSAVAQHCTHLFVLGDVFESRTAISIPVLDRVCLAFAKAEEQLRVVVLAGNHDSYLRDTSLTSTRVLQGVVNHVVTVPTVMTVDVGGGRIGLVPWDDDPLTLAQGVSTMRVAGVDYLFSHVMLKGAITGSPHGIPVTSMTQTEFKRVLLGDVHAPTKIGQNIQYLGAPLQINYGDVGGERGFWTLDLLSDELVFHANTESPRFHYVTDTETADAVREGDFARVKIADESDAKAVATTLRERTTWVEGVVEDVEDDEDDPRLSLRVSDSHEAALRKYAEHQGVGGNEALIKVGMDIMAEARD